MTMSFTLVSPAAGERVAKAMYLPLGLANPLWLTFGAAASAGAAWWMMTRWARPADLEAAATALLAPVAVAAIEVDSIAEIVETAPAIEPAAVVDAAAVVADDLTRLVGVGPRTAAALAERGVTTFAQLAAWTEAEMAAFDTEMKLLGRSARSAWLDQAKTLAAG